MPYVEGEGDRYEFTSRNERIEGIVANQIVGPEEGDPDGRRAAEETLSGAEVLLKLTPEEFLDEVKAANQEGYTLEIVSIVAALPFADTERSGDFLEAGLSAELPADRDVMVAGIAYLGMFDPEQGSALMAQAFQDTDKTVKERAELTMSMAGLRVLATGEGQRFVDLTLLEQAKLAREKTE